MPLYQLSAEPSINICIATSALSEQANLAYIPKTLVFGTSDSLEADTQLRGADGC